VSGTAKAMEVWNAGLEYAQGDEDKFRRYLDGFDHWADKLGPPEAGLAAKAIRFRLIVRKDKSLMVRWGMQ
jgi:hypothetical protein